ncbi:MAG: DNA alkylation repair protein [Actinomycetota bacterium]|nr:DNA alkylation repair protein [Actinomycetota bacterium]
MTDHTDALDLAWLRAALTAVADPSKVDAMRAYMKDIAPFLGVTAADRRHEQRRFITWARTATGDAAVDALLDFAEACWAEPEREFQYVATDMLRAAATRRDGTMLRQEHLPRVEQLLRAKSWWDTVDSLAAWTVGPMVLAQPALVSTMDEWIDDDDFWIARTAILHQLSYGRATDRERLFRYVDRRSADNEFFIRKALGWALRQYARVAPDEVRSFVEARGSRLSGLTRREALKHLGS